MTTHFDESQTERELREALSERAREVRPSSRLDAILREASEPEAPSSRSRWMVGVGVAAAAAVVAGTVWASRPDPGPTLPGGPPSTSSTPSSTSSPAPSASPSTSATPSPSDAPTTSGPAGPTSSPPSSLGVYRVGTNGGTQDRPGLVREFWPTPAGVGTLESDRARLAVAEAMRRSDLWSGVEPDRLAVTRDDITLTLSGPGREAPDAEQATLGVASLVWTAQAAVGRGDLPVEVRSATPGLLLGHLEPSRTFTRASTPPDALCDIWLDAPAPGASVSASRPVVARGQAVAFEANVEWELRQGATVVRDGFTTASVGAPSRGTFTVDLGRLEAGTWTFRAFTSSAEDGSTVAERVVTFSVR
ncbi:Gmad2 immunoglobulin-like domain-containing protein [Knoellia locipacati]|uniref:Gmad2 immunoglobulin-like domain-containing protein n=1 Tax=Knoellia locipacati TaxID=882824 RepID=UPI00384D7818